MTTAAGSPAGNPGILSRLLLRLGHFSTSTPAFLFLAGYYLMGSLRWWGINFPVWLEVVRVILGATVVMALLATLRHDRVLCVHCLHETPLLDPQGAVDRHRGSLLLFHSRTRLWALTAIGLLPAVMSLMARTIVGFPIFIKVLLTLCALASFACLAMVLRAATLHQRLQPWCPFCRRRDKDDDVNAPTPDPVGTANN